MESAAIALYSTGIGMQAGGAYQAGEAQAAWLNYDAALAQREAEITAKKTSYEVAAFRRQGEKFKAEQRATVGAAGVRLEGSPLEVLAETASQIERDALMTRHIGKVQEQKYLMESKLLKTQAKYAKKAGRLGAATSLLTGLGTLGLYGYEKGLFGKKSLTPEAKATFLRY